MRESLGNVVSYQGAEGACAKFAKFRECGELLCRLRFPLKLKELVYISR